MRRNSNAVVGTRCPCPFPCEHKQVAEMHHHISEANASPLRASAMQKPPNVQSSIRTPTQPIAIETFFKSDINYSHGIAVSLYPSGSFGFEVLISANNFINPDSI